MIHVASYKLLVTDAGGKPTTLDIGLLEKRLADAFRKLGFSDVWMAEDVAMTVEEKIRTSDATFVAIEDVDSIVVSVLNASGFQDVAREYARSGGGDYIGTAKKDMKPWKGRIAEVLRHALPLTEKQIGDVSQLAEQVLEASGIATASDKFLVELAVHLLVNNSADHVHFVHEAHGSKVPKPSIEWQDTLGLNAREMISQGVIKPMPLSEIFPRARIAVMSGAMASIYADGWISPLGIYQALDRISPFILEILGAIRREIAARHPLQADSPSHVVFPGFEEFLEREPNLWRKRQRAEIKTAVEQILAEKVVAAAEFPVVVSIR